MVNSEGDGEGETMKAKWATSRRSRKLMRSTKERTRRRMEEVPHELRHFYRCESSEEYALQQAF